MPVTPGNHKHDGFGSFGFIAAVVFISTFVMGIWLQSIPVTGQAVLAESDAHPSVQVVDNDDRVNQHLGKYKTGWLVTVIEAVKNTRLVRAFVQDTKKITVSPDIEGIQDNRSVALNEDEAALPDKLQSVSAVADAVPLDGELAEPAGDDASIVQDEPGSESESDQAMSGDEDPAAGQLAIRGRVVDATGGPVDNISLVAKAQRVFNSGDGHDSANASSQYRAVTADGGYFEFNGLPDGMYSISSVASQGYAWSQILVRAGTGSALLVLDGQESLHIAGLLTGERGEPLAGVRVTVPGLIGASGVYSDPMGQYHLGLQLRQGSRSVYLQFEHAGYREKVLHVTASVRHLNGDTLMRNVDLEPVEQPAMVAGTLVSTDGRPVANESVELFSQEVGRRYRAVSDGAGAFLMTGVSTADDYLLRVRPVRQYRDYTKSGLQVGPGSTRLSVELEPLQLTGSLSGRMLDLHGNPVPGYTLLLQPEGTSKTYLEVTGDHAGNFRIDSAPEGRVVLQSPQDPMITIRGVEIVPGAANDAALVLDIGQQQLHGQVLDENGRPMNMQPVILSWLHRNSRIDSLASRSTLADQEGRFSFTGLGPGSHTLRIAAPGYRTLLLEHDLDIQGEVLSVQLERTS